MESETLSVKEAAEELGVHPSTVTNLLNDPESGLKGRRKTTARRSHWLVFRVSLDEYKRKLMNG